VKKTVCYLLLAAVLFPCYALAGQNLTPAQKKFAHQLASRDHFNEKQVLQWLANSSPSKQVLFSTAHPKEDASWARYRRLFVSEKNIQGGVAFYKKYHKTLHQAYQRYGVDPLAIVAIVGIESHFGAQQGTHQAARALNTLAFYGSAKRQHMFQEQLRALFLLSRQLNADPLSFKSSYSGALGQPQFMPTTYLHYAASPSAQKRLPDLFSRPDDVIFSVANYLAQVGWKKDRAIASTAKQASKQTLAYAENGKDKLWLKDANFKAVHRYNQSNKYVLAVSVLADEIRQQL
jgi:membrane-bound lytic murein transglycosylase B